MNGKKETSETRSSSYLLFILILSCFGLLLFIVSSVVELDADSTKILEWADILLCAVFMVDFLVTLKKSKNRWRYLYTWGWLDFLSSIPAVAVLRVARSARIFRIIKVLRAIRGARILSSMILKRKAANALYGMLILSLIFVVLASLSVLQFEKAASGANIKNAEDAIWWAVTTVTTVGYGDRFPVTREGRIIATFLMVVGVGLFGSLTGATASWFVSQKVQEEKEKELANS